MSTDWAAIARRTDGPSARVISAVERWRSVVIWPFAQACALSDQKDLIDRDVARWLDVGWGNAEGLGLHSLIYAFPEFRSVLYWRLECGNPTGKLLAKAMRLFWKPVGSLFIHTKRLGPGLFIAHGQGTNLVAERIGANCYIHQGVTLGWDYKRERGPIIGDDVFIGAGAAVLGAVTVGDGARIGAGAIVLSDVPPGATAVGVPARVVKPTLQPLERALEA